MEKIVFVNSQTNKAERIISQFLVLFVVVSVITSIFMSSCFADSDRELLNRASDLLQQQNPQSAYRILEKHEDKYAGWWEYDYLLGVAALESGKANLAIFSLQRALAMNPNLVGAHLDLGRAYYEVNELVPAKAEFNLVLTKKPNKKVNAVARNFLRRIENKSSPVRFSFQYTLESIAGYDSNANSATDEKTFNGFDLASENIRTASSFLTLKASTVMHAKMSKKNSFDLGASFSQRENHKISQVDYINASVNVGWKYRHKYAEQSIGGQFSRTNIANNLESKVSAMNFGLRFRLINDADLRFNSSFSYNQHDESQSNRNAIQTMLGANIFKKGIQRYHPSMTGSLIIGENIPRSSKSSQGKSLKGGRLGLQKVFPKYSYTKVRIDGGLLYSNYKNVQDGISSEKRADQLTDISLTLSVRILKSWETSIKSSYSQNKSNIDLYKYTRISGAFSVRKYL